MGVSLLFGRSRTRDFLRIEIDEGVRKVSEKREPRTWLHVVAFGIGLLAYLESWIQSNGGWGSFGSDGIISNFILNALLLLLGPFFLWVGGALVLGRIGAAGPNILTMLLSWSPAFSDIRRGLRGSGSSESVNRLAVIMLLTLSIVTLAAVQDSTGTVVDERTTCAQTGADMQVQFDSPVTEEQARAEVMLAIQRAGEGSLWGGCHPGRRGRRAARRGIPSSPTARRAAARAGRCSLRAAVPCLARHVLWEGARGPRARPPNPPNPPRIANFCGRARSA